MPFLAAYRLKDSGLRKREAWEHTWNLQRKEDGGEKVGTIPVPPKYTSADFRKQSWWQHRGKLDVPKERFILYPFANREGDDDEQAENRRDQGFDTEVSHVRSLAGKEACMVRSLGTGA